MSEHKTPEGHSLIKTEQLNELIEQNRLLKTEQRQLYTELKKMVSDLGIDTTSGKAPDLFELMNKIPALLNSSGPSPFAALQNFLQKYESENLVIKGN